MELGRVGSGKWLLVFGIGGRVLSNIELGLVGSGKRALSLRKMWEGIEQHGIRPSW